MACPSCQDRREVVDFWMGTLRPCAICRKEAYEAWQAPLRPMTRRLAALNDAGQCCGRKPIPYKRAGYLYCTRCDAAFSIETKKQIANSAWRVDGDAFVAAIPQAELARIRSLTEEKP